MSTQEFILQDEILCTISFRNTINFFMVTRYNVCFFSASLHDFWAVIFLWHIFFVLSISGRALLSTEEFLRATCNFFYTSRIKNLCLFGYIYLLDCNITDSI